MAQSTRQVFRGVLQGMSEVSIEIAAEPVRVADGGQGEHGFAACIEHGRTERIDQGVGSIERLQTVAGEPVPTDLIEPRLPIARFLQ